MKEYDVIIIGGGPAGASCALYCARGGLDALMLYGGASALCRAELIQNFYGAGTVTGKELYARGIEQAKGVGCDVKNEEATFASFDGERFVVSTAAGEYAGKRLAIATGAARKSADIAGLKELEGKGVSYCAVCDAFFYRKKRVGVLGNGEFARHEYEVLKRSAAEVVLFTNGGEASFDASPVFTQKLKRVSSGADGKVNGAELDDGTVVAVDGLFVALGVLGSSAIAKSMGVLTDPSGAILTDSNGMTNVAGLYAAGDCTVGIKQVAKAANDGMNVAMAIIKDLKGAGE